MNIASALERGRVEYPDRTALVFEDRTWTYVQLDEACGRAAAELRRLGAGRGDRVALWMPNSPAFVCAYFGALKLGAVVVAVNTALKPEELDFILADSGARLLVTTAERADTLAGLAPSATQLILADGADGADAFAAGAASPVMALALVPDEPAAILYTSGTTGTPKGAVLTHGNIVDNGRACVAAFGLLPEDRLLLCLPLYHCFGQNAALNPCFEAGATLLLHRQFEPVAMNRAVADHAATVFFGVPTVYSILLDQAEPPDWRRVRRFISAASALPARLAEGWRSRFGAPIQPGYGLTETCLCCFDRDPAARGPDSVGTPLDGVEVRVIAIDGQDAAAGETGELAVRGSNVMRGYWNRPEANAEAFREGWFLTGDLARIDATGAIHIVDRVKDMVNVGGTKVYPSEVEVVLARHPAIAESAVYAIPDSLLGERVAAVVVFHPGQAVPAAELLGFCTRHLAGFKVPAQFEAIDALPKSATGKILKRVLAERHRNATVQGPAKTPGAAAIEQWLTDWIGQRLEWRAERPAADRPARIAAYLGGKVASLLGLEAGEIPDFRYTLNQLGLDSLMIIDLRSRVTRDLGVALPVATFLDNSIAALAGSLAAALATAPGDGDAGIAPAPRDLPLPLSHIQEEVWRRSQNPALKGIYNLPIHARITGRLDPAVLREAFDALVERHEILRTTYATVEGGPVQVIAATAAVPWATVELSALPDAEQALEIERLAEEEEQREFDLARGPLLRATLLCLGETEHRLLLAAHHIALDARSTSLLLAELGGIYAARVSGQLAELPSQPIQYADFAHWQRRTQTPEVLAPRLAYWQALLSDPPPDLNLPTDRPRPPEREDQAHPSGAERLLLSPDLVARLKDVGRRHDATFYMVLLAAYAALLGHYGRSEDLVIGAPSSRRDRPELESVLGHFAGRSWLRIDLSGQPSFPDLLARTRRVVLAALENQYLTLRQWLAATEGHVSWRPEWPLSARASFNLWPSPAATELPGATLRLIPSDYKVIPTDIALNLWEEPADGGPALRGFWLYRTDLFEPATIARLVADYRRLLEAVAADPVRGLESLADRRACDADARADLRSTGHGEIDRRCCP